MPEQQPSVNFGDIPLARGTTPQESAPAVNFGDIPTTAAPASGSVRPSLRAILSGASKAVSPMFPNLPETVASPILNYIKNNPAQAGAMALAVPMGLATGGMGAPAAIGLAGLAGAGGAGAGLAASQLANAGKEPLPTVSGNIGQMASQGGQMAAAEGAGRAISAGMQAGSKYLMNRAMNNVSRRLGQEFPTMTQAMIDNAITASQGGYDKARSILIAAKATANAAVKTAEDAGATIPVTAATDALGSVADRIANTGNPTGNLAKLARVEEQFTAGRGATLTPTEADAIKGELQREARDLYLKLAKGEGTPAMRVVQEAKAAMAAGLNQALDAATTAAGADGYRAANATAQQMIGITRGIRSAVRPNANLYQALVRPGMGALAGAALGETQGHPGLGALAGAALGSPQGLSRAAILLGNPAVQAFMGQLPKPMVAAISNYLTGEQPEADVQK